MNIPDDVCAAPADPFDMTGQVVLVTGASSGLGRRFATLLAGRGAKVALCARRAGHLESLAQEIAAAGGIARAFPLDVTDVAAFAPLLDQVEAALGAVDVLLNNAGVAGQVPTLDVDEAHYDSRMAVNLKGPFSLALTRP